METSPVSVHLVAAPWADPLITPIQTACLKAWLDERYAGAVPVRTYAPFLEIPLRVAGLRYRSFHRYFREVQREALSELAFHARYGEPNALDVQAEAAAIDQAAIARADASGNADRFRVDSAFVEALAAHTCAWVDEVLVPNLGASINVVGFTLNFNQTFPSALIARRILERAPIGSTTVIVFGGGSVAHPHCVDALVRAGVPGLIVLGEGENKLVGIVERASEGRPLVDEENGVFSIESPPDLYDEHPSYYKEQLGNLNQLPLPDYREYFERATTLLDPEDVNAVQLAMEGTRGCFAKCDFCSLNRNWLGFRSKAPQRIRENLRALHERHGKRFVYFMDNVCDSWAEKLAELVASEGQRVECLMELRAHHDESFWTKLALAGLVETQVGVEALSAPLLERMSKGTSVMQNLRAIKYLTELEVVSTINSNIITHHPKSTVDDVRETQRLLERTLHLGKMQLVRFRLEPGCPLFAELSDTERRAGVHDRPHLGVERRLPLPARWCDPDRDAAWDELSRWYEAQRIGDHEMRVVSRGVGPRVVRVGRRGSVEHQVLDGPLATAFDRCHDGPRADLLFGEVPGEAVLELVRRGLVLELEGRLLTLATRRRQELVERLRLGRGARLERRRRLELVVSSPEELA
jgi:radical SAM superfamily enzyme YgiQ (UPF0313 family)